MSNTQYEVERAPTSVSTWAPHGEFQAGDTLVIFGEVFERGYVNGLIQEAERVGMQVIYTTVGRRDEAGQLRPLTPEEVQEKNQPHLINIALEAGFDMEPDRTGQRPVDQLKEYGLTGWESAQLNWASINECRINAVERFRKSVRQVMSEIEKKVDLKKNIIFAHTMAGGFPRAKVVMPIANKVFKGSGLRYFSSQIFWESDIGKLCDLNFKEVTAETYHHLIDLSSELRAKVEAQGAQVHYLAYGYHGNEVLVDDDYEWYSYSPYLQGFAKVRLEEISLESAQNGLNSVVFNVPEILTNSSSIFLGVEVVLYRLIEAMRREAPDCASTQKVLESCQQKLKDGVTIENLAEITYDYITNPIVRSWPKLKGWPQHNEPEQMALMRNTSTQLIELHKDSKNLMTKDLSEVVFKACGKVIYQEIQKPRSPVIWLGHDIVAKVSALSIAEQTDLPKH